ncbi:hypothetical protein [Neomoorella thermoacetica]|uniref:Uncharacterized protein n=2 Tax=Neomoorella thermoacetica TaxID=1525 RepID=A0A1J5JGV8_NEOTH|nr:hypothetical protein [Moorella thermoacetica]AKX94459.1 hypothetical protein MOTHE_c16660 [Moorella thermoacetica]AKX97095.1 hypothetical protein MOTHA_c17490 [Moorella thermoacetica]OIQ08413.1 hypothetical protein MOOR_19560 [Moorella thermoacetica]OIQ11740.1 hypothetical protein MOOTH_13320 [Moorella thermoacetica]OIQ55200.1 hypothetical protein MORE_09550 [Moorella thermoacetica]
MPLTASATVSGSTAGTADVALTLSPATALFSPANLVPGQVVGSPQLEVANTGTVDEYYFIFADWQGVSPTTATEAQVLADRLNIYIEASPSTVLYNGNISGLYNQPASGRLLISPQADLLTFVVSLPDTAGNIVQNLDLSVDLVFTAQASPLA